MKKSDNDIKSILKDVVEILETQLKINPNEEGLKSLLKEVQKQLKRFDR